MKPVLFVLPLALLVAPSPLGWSDPVLFGRASIAAPPAVAVLEDRLHVIWLDRRGASGPTGEVWHAVLSPTGRLLRPPARLQSSADVRLAWPVAVTWGRQVVAAWMARSPDGVMLELAILDRMGEVQRILRPDPVPREEAGRLALGVGPDGTLHAAWSQFDGTARRIWYVRLDPHSVAEPRAAPLVAGDAPALLLDPAPRLFLWESLGSSTYRLVTASLASGVLGPARPLTGTISLAFPLPVLPARTPGGPVLLIPTLERAFATSGRLYGMRLAGGDGLPPRLPLLGQSRVSDVSLAEDGEGAMVFWSQAVGRRQNSEIHAARLRGDAPALLQSPSRLTYTIPGSLRPAGGVLNGVPVAAWLEVAGFGEFTLVFGTAAAPRRHRFLLGITELDLYRPGALLAFSALSIGSVLPFAAIVTATAFLPALLALYLMQLLSAPFERLEHTLRRPAVRLGLVLAVALALELAGAGLVPGRPSPALLAVPLAALGLPVLAVLASAADRAETAAWALLGVVIVFVQSLVVLFPWGAAQLTQF